MQPLVPSVFVCCLVLCAGLAHAAFDGRVRSLRGIQHCPSTPFAQVNSSLVECHHNRTSLTSITLTCLVRARTETVTHGLEVQSDCGIVEHIPLPTSSGPCRFEVPLHRPPTGCSNLTVGEHLSVRVLQLASNASMTSTAPVTYTWPTDLGALGSPLVFGFGDIMWFAQGHTLKVVVLYAPPTPLLHGVANLTTLEWGPETCSRTNMTTLCQRVADVLVQPKCATPNHTHTILPFGVRSTHFCANSQDAERYHCVAGGSVVQYWEEKATVPCEPSIAEHQQHVNALFQIEPVSQVTTHLSATASLVDAATKEKLPSVIVRLVMQIYPVAEQARSPEQIIAGSSPTTIPLILGGDVRNAAATWGVSPPEAREQHNLSFTTPIDEFPVAVGMKRLVLVSGVLRVATEFVGQRRRVMTVAPLEEEMKRMYELVGVANGVKMIADNRDVPASDDLGAGGGIEGSGDQGGFPGSSGSSGSDSGDVDADVPNNSHTETAAWYTAWYVLVVAAAITVSVLALPVVVILRHRSQPGNVVHVDVTRRRGPNELTFVAVPTEGQSPARPCTRHCAPLSLVAASAIVLCERESSATHP